MSDGFTPLEDPTVTVTSKLTMDLDVLMLLAGDPVEGTCNGIDKLCVVYLRMSDGLQRIVTTFDDGILEVYGPLPTRRRHVDVERSEVTIPCPPDSSSSALQTTGATILEEQPVLETVPTLPSLFTVPDFRAICNPIQSVLHVQCRCTPRDDSTCTYRNCQCGSRLDDGRAVDHPDSSVCYT